MRVVLNEFSEADLKACEIICNSSTLVYISPLLCVMTPDRAVVFLCWNENPLSPSSYPCYLFNLLHFQCFHGNVGPWKGILGSWGDRLKNQDLHGFQQQQRILKGMDRTNRLTCYSKAGVTGRIWGFLIMVWSIQCQACWHLMECTFLRGEKGFLHRSYKGLSTEL